MYIRNSKGEESANIGFHFKPSISPLFFCNMQGDTSFKINSLIKQIKKQMKGNDKDDDLAQSNFSLYITIPQNIITANIQCKDSNLYASP